MHLPLAEAMKENLIAVTISKRRVAEYYKRQQG